MPQEKESFARLVGKYSSLATILPASILVGYGIGYYLDKYFGTHYWYLVWLLIGIAAGLRDLVRKVFVDFPKDVDSGDDPK